MRRCPSCGAQRGCAFFRFVLVAGHAVSARGRVAMAADFRDDGLGTPDAAWRVCSGGLELNRGAVWR
jgi:hypothetical protein